MAACGGTAEEPRLRIGDIDVPEAAFLARTEAAQRTLADLIAFGSAVANEEVDLLLEPLVDRANLEARADLLPVYLGAADVGLDEAALRTAYERRPEWELDVRHVVILVDPATPRARRDSAYAIAVEVAQRAAAGEDFATLAAQHSQEPGAAERGGLLQPGRRGSWVDPFWETAVSLLPGQTSGVVETEYGYHVIKVDDRRPVPFEEADRAELLRRLVSPASATAAFERWSAAEGTISVNQDAVAAAFEMVASGEAIPPGLVLATLPSGGDYTFDDLVVGWAKLTPAERSDVESVIGSFESWVTADARRILRGKYAEMQGVPLDAAATPWAAAEWSATVSRWVAAFEFAPGMNDIELFSTAMDGLLSGRQEARAARQELRSLRPLLRIRYPLEDASSSLIE